MKSLVFTIYSLLGEVELDTHIIKSVSYSLNTKCRIPVGNDIIRVYSLRLHSDEIRDIHQVQGKFFKSMKQAGEPYIFSLTSVSHTYGLYTAEGAYKVSGEGNKIQQLLPMWGNQAYMRNNHKTLRLIGAIP